MKTVVIPPLAILFAEKALTYAGGEDATADALEVLGLSYGNTGAHQKELKYLLASLEIRRKIFGEEHPDVASSYISVGATYVELGDSPKVLECYFKAMDIRKALGHS